MLHEHYDIIIYELRLVDNSNEYLYLRASTPRARAGDANK